MPDVSFTALTPLAFLGRSAEVFADKTAIVYGDRRLTYRAFAAEATRLARALQASGVRPGDRVAYLCPNIPELLVANFAVPLAGAILVPLNTRLSPDEIDYICTHAGAVPVPGPKYANDPARLPPATLFAVRFAIASRNSLRNPLLIRFSPRIVL